MTTLDIPMAGTIPDAITGGPLPAERTDEFPSAIEQLIVPLDGSAVAERALGLATDFAGVLGAGVQILCVAGDESEAQERRAYLRELTARTQIGPIDARVEVSADPGGTIAAAARQTPHAVVCMSSHGHGSLTSALLGSVSTSVLASTGDQLLMVGPATKSRNLGARVVACLDGSEESHQALSIAVRWATMFGVGVAVVTVAEPVPASLSSGDLHYRRRFGPGVDVERYLADVAARHGNQRVPIITCAIYNPLGVADGLEDYLRDHPARLLVVTTRARTGAPHPYLSHVAAEIVRSCPVPILLAPRQPVSA